MDNSDYDQIVNPFTKVQEVLRVLIVAGVLVSIVVLAPVSYTHLDVYKRQT